MIDGAYRADAAHEDIWLVPRRAAHQAAAGRAERLSAEAAAAAVDGWFAGADPQGTTQAALRDLLGWALGPLDPVRLP